MSSVLYNENGQMELVAADQVAIKLSCGYTVEKPEEEKKEKESGAHELENLEAKEAAKDIYFMIFGKAPHSNSKTVTILNNIKQEIENQVNQSNKEDEKNNEDE